MKKDFNTRFGLVTVKNVMIDNGFNHLEEGIDLNGGHIRPLTILGEFDLTTLNSSDIDQLIYENI